MSTPTQIEIPDGYVELADSEKNGEFIPGAKYLSPNGNWADLGHSKFGRGCNAVKIQRIIVPKPAWSLPKLPEGWIEHKGWKEAKPPVHPDTWIKARNRLGEFREGRAGDWAGLWKDDHSSVDFVAYKIITPAPEKKDDSAAKESPAEEWFPDKGEWAQGRHKPDGQWTDPFCALYPRNQFASHGHIYEYRPAERPATNLSTQPQPIEQPNLTNTMAAITPTTGTLNTVTPIELPAVGSRWAVKNSYGIPQQVKVIASSANAIYFDGKKMHSVETPEEWDARVKTQLYTRRELRRMSKPVKYDLSHVGGYTPRLRRPIVTRLRWLALGFAIAHANNPVVKATASAVWESGKAFFTSYWS